MLALAGCPTWAPTYLVADVHAANRPVRDALVGVYCAGNPRRDVLGVTGGSARMTDDTGRARLLVPDGVPASDCTVTVATPGFPTIETRGASVCASTPECPALDVDLALRASAPSDQLDVRRRSELGLGVRPASPPAEVAR